MEATSDFEVNPNGAPLGEEPTRNSDFKEASCKAWLRFPVISERLQIYLSGLSLSCPEVSISVRHRWNPQEDSLIHCMVVELGDRLLIPESHHRWEDSQGAAPAFYLLCKRLFIEMHCDEVQAFHPSGSVLFSWAKSSNFQTVIVPYERGQQIAEDYGYSWQWRDIWATEDVFPELHGYS